MKKFENILLRCVKVLIPFGSMALALQVLVAGFVLFSPLMGLIDTALATFTPLVVYGLGFFGWFEGVVSNIAWILIGFIPITFLLGAMSLSVFIMYKGVSIYKGLTDAPKPE